MESFDNVHQPPRSEDSESQYAHKKKRGFF